MRSAFPDRVYVGGTFDLFHPGHVELLRQAANWGEVWVALNTDEFAERYKRRPILNLKERARVVGACKYVHTVVTNRSGEDSKPTITLARPRYIVHGDDWTGPAYMAQLGVTEGWLARRGITLIYVGYTKTINTTEVIERCRRSRP